MKNLDRIIKIAINESINELDLYHASYSNFNRFNHRKYLSSGAGSQTFGWGTYLTDSFEIADSYAGKFIWQKFNEFVVSAEPENYIGNANQYDEDIIKEACSLFKQVVRIGIVCSYGIERKYNRDFFKVNFDKSTGDPGEEYDSMIEQYEEFKEHLKQTLGERFNEVAEERLMYTFSIMNVNGDIIKNSRDEYVKEQSRINSINALARNIIDNIWDDADKHVKKESYIYEVSTPDDNGSNYIDYDNPVSSNIAKLISKGVMTLYRRFGENVNYNRIDNLVEDCMNGSVKGKYLYEELSSAFGGSDKAASLFLNQCGIVGIKYKAGTIYGLPNNADENSMNYVIFDASKIKINSRNLFEDDF